jgi:hypothetical protein
MKMLLLLPLCLLGADPRAALTFEANFNQGVNANLARGDARIYYAENYKEGSVPTAGLGQAPVVHENGALRFTRKHTTALFFKADGNVSPTTGSFAFKLKLDPNADLPPDWVDPIQLTDKAYNDSALWVDFTKDDRPRNFRLGVFGELKAWNPNNLPGDKNPAFNNRLVVKQNPPFTRERWTRVVITYEGLGTPQGKASLYVNGELVGNNGTPITEAFRWEPGQATIRLGVNYIGWMDDLAAYSRALTAEEVRSLK